VTAGWRVLRNEELHNLYTPPYVVRIGGTGSTHGEMRNAFSVLVWNPEGKGPVGIPMSRIRRRTVLLLPKMISDVLC
jgi:hypothetical protein